jgi:hypothetical protein
MEKQNNPQPLDESIFPKHDIYETEQDLTVFEIALPRQLSEDESNEYAQRLANYMFEMGHKDFDIEGVQFHPESVLTEGGHKMLAEWLVRCGDLDARNLAQGLQPVIPN